MYYVKRAFFGYLRITVWIIVIMNFTVDTPSAQILLNNCHETVA